jgi:hypothetical protein
MTPRKALVLNIAPAPRARRGRFLAATALLLAPLVLPLTDSTITHAAASSLSFENGEAQITVGPNTAIYIDGTITYDAACTYAGEGKITDFVYPATDVYVVTAGSASIGTTLEDVGGNGPNTVVALSSGLFAAELIAVVTPSGSLGAGTYDVVYDTCQDGVVGVDDKVFASAVTVELPDGELPPVDASIAQLKEQARQQYAFWLQAHIALTALFNVEEAQALVECILAPSPGCLADLLTKLFGIDGPTGLPMNWIKDQALQLVMNRAKNYGAIWQDPPDADFRRLPVVVPDAVRESPASGSAVADALDALTEPLADEGALADALLHAI